MRSFTIILASLTAFVSPILGSSPTPLISVTKLAGDVNNGSFIVKLKDHISRDAHLGWLSQQPGANVTYSDWHSDLLYGYAGKFSDDVISLLRANSDVEYIEEDGIVSADVLVTQTNAPWGLARISQDERLVNQDVNALTFTYRHDSSAGAGVDIYVVDTGIFIQHVFFQGRARWGATFGPYEDADGNGHGTHAAGTAAAAIVGVANRADLIAVKVLSDEGPGTGSDLLAGLDFVLRSARSSGRPSVINLSLSTPASQAIDNAVLTLINNGIHAAVAAGNQNIDAANRSPARLPAANTIGASTIADAKASFSNFGSAVDLFAPGQHIISTWITGPTDIASISGTSMATPHVAGLIAYFIGRHGDISPAAMSSLLKSFSVGGVLTGIPVGTANALARNDV